MLSTSDLSGRCGAEPHALCLGTIVVSGIFIREHFFFFSFACHDNHDWIEVALGTFWRYLCTRIRVVLKCIMPSGLSMT
jgi:hypothetical protein